MKLENDLRQRLQAKPILLMTHLVLGYPSFEINRQVIAAMVDNGVDCIELQIPFSEPMADGPTILKANQDALEAGARVAECMEFAAEMAVTHDCHFLFMTYYNIVFRYGEERFLARAASMGIKGTIIPDLPPEEGERYLQLCRKYELAPILFFTPTSTDQRLARIAELASGFIYCVARRGVTGRKTEMNEDLAGYLSRCRQAASVPLAVGFGIRDREDIRMLEGQADMAVIGTRTIELVDDQGPEAVGPFIAGLSGETNR